SFDDIKDELEAHVNMGYSDATWRDCRDIGWQLGRAPIFGRHALLIMNAVPIPPGAAATNGQYPIVIFDRAELDVVLVIVHNKRTYQCFATRTGVEEK